MSGMCNKIDELKFPVDHRITETMNEVDMQLLNEKCNLRTSELYI